MYLFLCHSLKTLESITKLTYVRFFLTGDLMGPTVNNLDKLLRMPNGCGEQTMLGFAPDVFVSNYLSATHQLSSDIEEKAIGFMEKGMLYRLSTRDFTFTKNSEEMKHRNLLLKPRQISCLPCSKSGFYLGSILFIIISNSWSSVLLYKEYIC